MFRESTVFSPINFFFHTLEQVTFVKCVKDIAVHYGKKKLSKYKSKVHMPFH